MTTDQWKRFKNKQIQQAAQSRQAARLGRAQQQLAEIAIENHPSSGARSVRMKAHLARSLGVNLGALECHYRRIEENRLRTGQEIVG